MVLYSLDALVLWVLWSLDILDQTIMVSCSCRVVFGKVIPCRLASLSLLLNFCLEVWNNYILSTLPWDILQLLLCMFPIWALLMILLYLWIGADLAFIVLWIFYIIIRLFRVNRLISRRVVFMSGDRLLSCEDYSSIYHWFSATAVSVLGWSVYMGGVWI